MCASRQHFELQVGTGSKQVIVFQLHIAPLYLVQAVRCNPTHRRASAVLLQGLLLGLSELLAIEDTALFEAPKSLELAHQRSPLQTGDDDLFGGLEGRGLEGDKKRGL